MKIQAVMVDVYQTVLEVLPPPADRAESWARLWHDFFQSAPPLGLDDFTTGCKRVILREHAASRTRGIAFPEVCWPDVAMEAAPALARLAGPERDAFLYRQAQTWHTVRLMEGAAEALRTLAARGVTLGIASNAQPYTLHELRAALAPEGLNLEIFAPALCFWSFDHGFSKPDPHVFQLLTARLRARGITPAATLMVGDRSDNDLAPARAQGWQTWQLRRETAGEGSGGPWRKLLAVLALGEYSG